MIVLISIVLSLSACTTQHNVNNFYNKYQGIENSMSFQAPLFLASLIMDNEFDAFRQKIKSVRFLTLNDLDKTEYSTVNNEIKNALSKDGFTNWFNVNDDGNNINVSAQNRGKSVRNIVISFQGFDNLILVNAKTQLTEQELTKFIMKFINSTEKTKSADD